MTAHLLEEMTMLAEHDEDFTTARTALLALTDTAPTGALVVAYGRVRLELDAAFDVDGYPPATPPATSDRAELVDQARDALANLTGPGADQLRLALVVEELEQAWAQERETRKEAP